MTRDDRGRWYLIGIVSTGNLHLYRSELTLQGINFGHEPLKKYGFEHIRPYFKIKKFVNKRAKCMFLIIICMYRREVIEVLNPTFLKTQPGPDSVISFHHCNMIFFK